MKIKEILSFAVLMLWSCAASAQTEPPKKAERSWQSNPRAEVIAAVGMAHVFRFEDRGYGSHTNIGAGVEFPVWRRLRVGAEFNRTFGLSPEAVPCGSIGLAPGKPLPCVGSAREGVAGVTAASFTGAYYFGNRKVQPYLLGGMSLLKTETYSAVSIVHPDRVEFIESSSRGTGAGLTFGMGFRAAVTRRLSIRPEFRFSDGTLLSSANLSQMRLSLGIGYSW